MAERGKREVPPAPSPEELEAAAWQHTEERYGPDASLVAPHRQGPQRPPGIRQGQRVLAVGNTGEGKSEALAHLWAIHGGQRLLVDVNDGYELGPAAIAEGACVADHPREIDWRCRTIRYVPRTLAQREYDELYRHVWVVGDLLVWLDEAFGPTTEHVTPPWLKRVVTQGRKRRITHLAATQRPAGIERTIVNQSEHAFVFRMVDPDDIAAISYRGGALRPRELADALAELPEHGFLYHTLGAREIRAMPPLPAKVVAATRRHVIIPS
jgi:hypothetical protein